MEVFFYFSIVISIAAVRLYAWHCKKKMWEAYYQSFQYGTGEREKRMDPEGYMEEEEKWR
jgi:hypothetical protein